jgi:hypothetical protein
METVEIGEAQTRNAATAKIKQKPSFAPPVPLGNASSPRIVCRSGRQAAQFDPPLTATLCAAAQQFFLSNLFRQDQVI